MPVQLGLLDDIVVIEPPPEVPTAAKTAIDLKMLGCYQMRPGYEAMDFMVTGESLETGCIQGYVNGRSKMRWKALAQPQLAFEFDFKKVLESYAEPQSHRLDFVAADAGTLTAVVFWHELVLKKAEPDRGREAIVLGNKPMRTNKNPSRQQVCSSQVG